MKEFSIEYCEGVRDAYNEINGLLNTLNMAHWIDIVAKNKLQEFTAMRLQDVEKRVEYILDVMEESE